MNHIEINNGKATYLGVDITDKPMLNWTTANGKSTLKPSLMEKRDNRVTCVDKNEGLYEVYFKGELDCIIRGKDFAEKYLQSLIEEEEWNS